MKPVLAVTLLGLLACALMGTAAARPKAPHAAPPWPAVGQAVQYVPAPGALPQAALITSRIAPGTGGTYPVVRVIVFPPGSGAVDTFAGYCLDGGYPCLQAVP